jgi:hypothetical protein
LTEKRAFRGLLLVFLISFLNLAGILLTVTALGGLGDWTRWQFVGLFGVIEAASGLANIIVPNIWHLPVTELETRTKARFAASVIMLPHWGGAARALAGLLLIGLAGWQEGVGVVTLALVPAIFLLAFTMIGVSALVARAGVARPDLDVVQAVIRWRGKVTELPGLSLSASVLQFLLGIITIPAVKLLPPDVLYQPELGPSRGAFVVILAVAMLVAVAVVAVWGRRIDWHAPPEQQREMARNA